MVNATVDNTPVSIVLDGGQSTTVPSNETWRVSIYTATTGGSTFTIDGIGDFETDANAPIKAGPLVDVTLVGGQTITETTGLGTSAVFITGFVVNS